MKHLPPVNLWNYRRFLEEIFTVMLDKTYCANSQRCTNTDCLRHPPTQGALKEELLKMDWNRIRWVDYHQPRANLYCPNRQEEDK